MELNWFFVELDLLSENVGEILFYFYYLSHGSRIGGKVQGKVHTKSQIIFQYHNVLTSFK